MHLYILYLALSSKKTEIAICVAHLAIYVAFKEFYLYFDYDVILMLAQK